MSYMQQLKVLLFFLNTTHVYFFFFKTVWLDKNNICILRMSKLSKLKDKKEVIFVYPFSYNIHHFLKDNEHFHGLSKQS